MSGRDVGTVAFFLRGQALHLLFLVALVPIAWALAAPALADGEWLGVSDTGWFALCVAEAVFHQTYVWLCWRAQLRWQAFTRAFGRADFAVYATIFYLLLLLRPALIAAVAAADAGTLALSPTSASALATLLALPAIYTSWSVRRYFGFARAAGGDHFRARYREMPLVDRGAFAWTPNAMYTFSFLGLWAIALFGHSHAALVAALFQHAYIWVHYLSTERPDMELLYGARTA